VLIGYCWKILRSAISLPIINIMFVEILSHVLRPLFYQLKSIYFGLNDNEILGIRCCKDTQHAFSGYISLPQKTQGMLFDHFLSIIDFLDWIIFDIRAIMLILTVNKFDITRVLFFFISTDFDAKLAYGRENN
jgi:hypothetical protein